MRNNSWFLTLALISAAASVPAKAQDGASKAKNPACESAIQNISNQGINPTNLMLASTYYDALEKPGQNRFVILAETGDQQANREGTSYNGWLKVLDRTTGHVRIFPMQGPGYSDPTGAYRYQGSGKGLETLSTSLKAQKADLGIKACDTAKATICLSKGDQAALDKLLGADKPLVVVLPGTHNTGGGPGEKRPMFSRTSINNDGLDRSKKKLKELADVSMKATPCKYMLRGTPGSAGSAPSSEGAAPSDSGMD